MLPQSSLNFLQRYLNNPSPTSREYMGQQMWLDYLKPYIDEYVVDAYGSVAGMVNPHADYKVAIEAHADEIGWMVNYIDEKGFLWLIRNGGSDHMIAPSMRAHIHTADGKVVEGVFGWPAIHVRERDQEKVPKVKDLFVDIGCDSREEVLEKGVHVGALVTYQDQMTWLNEQRYLVGRAVDNRIGGFVIAEVARRLKEEGKQLPFGLCIVNSVQEEVGLRGALMISRRLKPDVAVSIDVCHDTQSPQYDKKAQGDFTAGKGPVLTYAPAVQNNLLKMLFEVARKNEIAYQVSASSPGSGTNTDSFAYGGEGIPSALISLPIKYMHTTVEMAHHQDIEQCIELYYQFLLHLDAGHDFRYIK